MKLFTKERIVLGLIGGIVTVVSAVWVAKIQAQSLAKDELNAFKQTTIADLGNIRGDVKEIKAILEVSNVQWDKRLETIQGIIQTNSSRIDKIIQRDAKI